MYGSLSFFAMGANCVSPRLAFKSSAGLALASKLSRALASEEMA